MLLYVTLNCQFPSSRPDPRHLAYREAQLQEACLWPLWTPPMLDSSAHMLCLGSTPVLQHSSASLLSPGVLVLKEPWNWSQGAQFRVLTPKLPTLNSLPPLLQWPPVVLGRISQVNNPFKRNVCVCVYPNYWLIFITVLNYELCTKKENGCRLWCLWLKPDYKAVQVPHEV